MKSAAIAPQRYGHANQRRDTGTVNLRDVVQINNDFARSFLQGGSESGGKLVTGIADGQAAVNIKNMRAVFLAHIDFNGSVLGHRKEICRRALYDEGGRDTQMRLAVEHKWNVSVTEARAIQEKLRGKFVGDDRLGEIRTVAGLDAAFVLTGSQAFASLRNRWMALREANRAIAAVFVYKYPEMVELERVWAVTRLQFPYVPGFLSFREIPVLLKALQKLRRLPDLLFCDGQGYAHPRRMGLATHLGIVLNSPTIGCAKSILVGTHGEVGNKTGDRSPLKENEATIGAALRTRAGVKPVYVSQGNRVSLETALRLTLSVCDGKRIPRPTRDADHWVSELKRRLVGPSDSDR